MVERVLSMITTTAFVCLSCAHFSKGLVVETFECLCGRMWIPVGFNNFLLSRNFT